MKEFLKGILGLLPGFILGILAAVIIPLMLDKLSITDSKLVHVGLPLMPISTAIQATPDGMFEYHVKHGVRFMNNGWRRGHVDRVEVARHGLSEYPEKVTVLHLDKSDLGWREEKTLEFEFIALLRPYPEDSKTITFRHTYYDTNGTEIHTGFMKIMGTHKQEPLQHP